METPQTKRGKYLPDFQYPSEKNTKSALAVIFLVALVVVMAFFMVPLFDSGPSPEGPLEEDVSPSVPDDLTLEDVLPHSEDDILSALGVSRAFAVEYGELDWQESKEDYYERLSPFVTDQLRSALPNRPAENDRLLASTREKFTFTVTTGTESIRSLSETSVTVVITILAESTDTTEESGTEEMTIALTLLSPADDESIWLVDDVQPADSGNLGEAPESEG